jgi:hypothetical protein
MKKEFMLYVRNSGDAKSALSKEKHEEFVKKREAYIGILQFEGKLISVQPLLREGISLFKTNNEWITAPVDAAMELQIECYHIFAQDMDEAIAIAKRNPEFDYIPTAGIEIRPVKMKEGLA